MVYTSSPEETHELAKSLASECIGGEIIGLIGELGAGKTEFVRGFLEYFGQAKNVASPTYVVEHIYNIPSTAMPDSTIEQVYHLDLYRQAIESFELEEQLREIALEGKTVALIEWAEIMPEIEDLLFAKVKIGIESGEGKRRVEVEVPSVE